jgi:hypothetical protein
MFESRPYVSSLNEASTFRCCDEGYQEGARQNLKRGGLVVGYHSACSVCGPHSRTLRMVRRVLSTSNFARRSEL